MSPTRRTMHQRKRLSFHLLYDGNEDNLARPDDENRRMEQELQESMGDDSNTPLHGNGDGTGNGSDTTTDQPTVHQDKESIQTENSNGVAQGDGRSMEIEACHLGTDDFLHDKNGTKSSPDKHSTIGSTHEEKQNGVTAKSSDISKVAARVVKGETELAARTKTSRSESIDASATSTTSNGSANRQYGRTSRSNSISSDYSASPGVGVGGGNRIRAAILPPLRISKDKRNKWLDHLNSFQESNHDVDLQMQEFIKVPGAVEKNLTSGFLICVDSFLYVCTILLIRFAWSCVLLSLHYFFKWTKKPAGKFQFHRR